MAYTITLRPDGGVVCEYRGIVTLADNEKARAEYTQGNPENFAKIPYLISDHSKTVNARHNAQDMQRLGAALNEFWRYNPRMLIALVVPKDLLFGLARMLYAFSEHEDLIALFRTREEAEIWIYQKLRQPSP